MLVYFFLLKKLDIFDSYVNFVYPFIRFLFFFNEQIFGQYFNIFQVSVILLGGQFNMVISMGGGHGAPPK